VKNRETKSNWPKASATSKHSDTLAPGIASVTCGGRDLGNSVAVAFALEGARGVAIVDIHQQTLDDGKKMVEFYGTKVCHCLVLADSELMLTIDGSV
jgi:hypothetical protein